MLLGVTYPSMAEIEASYDAVAVSEIFMKLASNISINLRNIIRIYLSLDIPRIDRFQHRNRKGSGAPTSA